MSNNVRNVTKQLLGAEDVAFGRGVVQQNRGGALVPIHKLDLDLPVADESELATTDTAKYPKASIGSRLFVAVNGQYQELAHIVPVIYRVGGALSAEYPYCENGNVIAKWTGEFPKTLTTEDADFSPVGWQIYTVGSGRTIVSETQPPVSYGEQGMRWYNPSLPATFIYYVDGDSGQWVEEAHEGIDGGLRADLALATSTVPVAGAPLYQTWSKLRSVNCLMFVPPEHHADAIAGNYDVSSAVVAAHIAADTLKIPYLEGAGTYDVGTLKAVLPFTRDITWNGAGRDLTKYVTSLDDGGTVFTITGQWYDVGEFRILSKSGLKKNFTGIKVGDTTTDVSFTRSRLRVKVSNAAVGVEARGWITDFDVFTNNCDLGFNGEELNSCNVILRGENNVQGFAINTAIGTTFNQLLEENTFTPGTTTVASYIDAFKGITIDSLYLEGGSFSTTAVVFAPTTQSYGLNLNTIASEIAPLDKSGAVIIDKVHGVNVAGNTFAGGFNATLTFTENAKGIDANITCPPAAPVASNSTMRLQDNSKQVRRAQNWSGDKCFDHLVSSFDAVTKTNVTLSADTANVITGKRSLRISANTGGTSPSLELRRTVNRLPKVANLVGKTIKAFAWVLVPSLPKYEDRTYQVGFEVAFGGGASLTSSQQRTTKAGCWNLIETPAITCPAGWTGASADRIALRFYLAGNTGAAFDAGYYIVVDSWFLCDGSVSILDIQRGNYEDYNLLGVASDGNSLTLTSDNFEGAVNADSSFSVGDKIEHATPAASGFIGKVCTTAGAVGSTAVFKTHSPISA